MAYPTNLLTDGESIELETRPHWRSMVVPSIWLLVIVGVGSFLYAKVPSDRSFSPWFHWGLVLVGLVLLLVLFVRPLVRWLTTQYVFTNRRIITRTGIVARSGRDMPYAKVNDVRFSFTIWERALHCGTLTVSSAAENGDLVIANVPRVEEIQRDIYRLAEADQLRRTGQVPQAGQQSAPPLTQVPPPAAPPAGPPDAPPAAPPA